jgi:hypothetical protein
VGSWDGGGQDVTVFSSTMWECTDSTVDTISGNIVGIFLSIVKDAYT